MPDRRSRRQKLEAMANQSASPNEAEVAKRKLAEERLRRVGFKVYGGSHPPRWGIAIDDVPLGRKTSPKRVRVFIDGIDVSDGLDIDSIR